MRVQVYTIFYILGFILMFGPAQVFGESFPLRHEYETDRDVRHHAMHDSDSHRHGRQAPIGIMGAHTHGAGDWMFSYRYMHMAMNGNRKGTSRVSESEVLEDFMVAPREMTMEMHMLGLMHAPTERFTLMAMIPYKHFSMDHITRMGTTFTTQSVGFGDLKLSGIYRLYERGPHRLHLNAGVGLPTGSIDEKDDTPAGSNRKLPYPMQLGSGTVDLLPGVTYLGDTDRWSWGAQAAATIRLGENDNAYTLGNRFELAAWLVRSLTSTVSASLRLDGSSWGNIDGADEDLSPESVPTADPDLRGGSRVDALMGLDCHLRAGRLKGHRISVEVGLPVYQNLDGPQLETDWLLFAGWQYPL